MIKAYYIDSERRVISNALIPPDNTLKSMQQLVGGWIEKAWELENRDWFVVDEEGLLRNPPCPDFFCVRGAHQPFVGNGVVVGADEEGETVDVKTSIEEIRDMVRFIDRNTVQTVYTVLGPANRDKFFVDLFTTPQAER